MKSNYRVYVRRYLFGTLLKNILFGELSSLQNRQEGDFKQFSLGIKLRRARIFFSDSYF